MEEDKTALQHALALIGKLASFALVGTTFVLAVKAAVKAETPFEYLNAIAIAITFSILVAGITIKIR